MSCWWLLLVPVAYVLGVWHGLFVHDECVNCLRYVLKCIGDLLDALSNRVKGDAIDCEYREVD